MKFIYYLQSIAGVGVFPMIGLTIFFTFFLVLVVWALRVNKEYINDMKNIPLEKVNETTQL